MMHLFPCLLSLPIKKVILSNVTPFISDETLQRKLSRHGKLVSPIKKLPSGCKALSLVMWCRCGAAGDRAGGAEGAGQENMEEDDVPPSASRLKRKTKSKENVSQDKKETVKKAKRKTVKRQEEDEPESNEDEGSPHSDSDMSDCIPSQS
ncbi:hypothetical protein LDENG_00194210 [Lucifuga dentata]|nr:hypothetical protein LDENG_00194210 [Lucifuga dentata]